MPCGPFCFRQCSRLVLVAYQMAAAAQGCVGCSCQPLHALMRLPDAWRINTPADGAGRRIRSHRRTARLPDVLDTVYCNINRTLFAIYGTFCLRLLAPPRRRYLKNIFCNMFLVHSTRTTSKRAATRRGRHLSASRNQWLREHTARKDFSRLCSAT